MNTDETPAGRVRELLALTGKISSCQGSLGYLSSCEDRMASTWTAEESAAHDAEMADLRRERDEAKAALETFLAKNPLDTPADRAAWADALAAVEPWVANGLADSLLEWPGPGRALAIPALDRALDSDSYAVRLGARDGIEKAFDLRRYYGGPDGYGNNSTEVEFLEMLLSQDLVSLVKIGVDGLRQMMRQLQAGATPESLGLMWKPLTTSEFFERLSAAAKDRAAAFPVEEIAQLTGLDRRWAEYLLARRVQDQDPRGLEPLVRLGAKWTVPVLEEIASLPKTTPEMREQITQSLRVLNG